MVFDFEWYTKMHDSEHWIVWVKETKDDKTTVWWSSEYYDKDNNKNWFVINKRKTAYILCQHVQKQNKEKREEKVIGTFKSVEEAVDKGTQIYKEEHIQEWTD